VIRIEGDEVIFESERLQHECGVFGLYAPNEDVSRTTYFGLFALQHRGQESAGITVSTGSELKSHRDMGLVSQVFSEEHLFELQGVAAIGHVRYSTTGSSVLRNSQPLTIRAGHQPFAIAHNGNLVNTDALSEKYQRLGYRFATTSDSEVLGVAIAHAWQRDEPIEQAVLRVMEELRGAYSVVLLTPDRVVAFKDPQGFRPLCLGQLEQGDGYVVASETCALSPIGARFLREIEPGEVAVLTQSKVEFHKPPMPTRSAGCIFEFIYFARPDSYIFGRNLHFARRRMGNVLAQEHPLEHDGPSLVIPVPDTGIPAAIGFAEASGHKFNEGFIKNRYIQRTFIQPNQRMRELGVRMKLSVLKEAVYDRAVVMVDDSIVRGTTTGPTVKLLRENGAREVHVRITAPPLRFPCFYGVDMATQDQLIAANLSVDKIRDHIGADSLGYLSPKGLIKAIGIPRSKFCMACFVGEYPTELPTGTCVANCRVCEGDPEADGVDMW
jgi:amidophosphoribosyltransferase